MGIIVGESGKPGDNQVVNKYVEQIDGVYMIAGSCVSLDSVVYAFRRGASPEGIQRSFPTISLEAVYGAIAYYLSNQEKIDRYLADGDSEFATLESESRSRHSDWYSRLESARKELPVS